MREWVRRWKVTVRWDRPRYRGGPSTREYIVTARQLGRLLARARDAPHVVAYPYEAVWQMVGDEPPPRGR